ncbi:MAG: pyruvate formate-lyase-activating protein [bacterium]
MLKVHSIETFGTHDGPGVRMVVFVQGCNFRCKYCQNPDTQNLKGGRKYFMYKLVQMAKQQKRYFGTNGGVTVSGGEPTLQAKDLMRFFRWLKMHKIHTALDTNGGLLNDEVKKLLKYTDLVLLDVKHIDDRLHREVTGVSNATTLKFAEYLEKIGKPFWLRYVLVPGYTDQKEFLIKFGEHFKNYKQIERLELIPYHRFGSHKFKEMGWVYPLEHVKVPTKEQLSEAREIFKQYFKKVAGK